MQDLIILGAGPHAAEMAEIVEAVNGIQPRWRLLGFLAAESCPVGAELNGYPVLGDLGQLAAYPHAEVALEYSVRPPAGAANRVQALVAPSAFVSRSARVGPGSVIYPHCFVGARAVLGQRVFVLAGAVINHDDRLEDDVTVCSGATLAGGVHVDSHAYLGQACTVRQNLRVGRGSLVGMGSVVTADVHARSVVAGNPARLRRWLDADASGAPPAAPAPDGNADIPSR
jgi:sugar O-acyltransferase (sialic acid O-acetyltransferase NeuD family)